MPGEEKEESAYKKLKKAIGGSWVEGWLEGRESGTVQEGEEVSESPPLSAPKRLQNFNSLVHSVVVF